ncbi:AcrR family transcriptional regulator [Arthrobacter pascens]|uniref:TetR/AcrR family transcriptional regulator n=1 Tax=Arthrobacter pascens TaxID=1677 RepID=UPI00285B9F2E|nr:helix-turn-helix domain-containing protein [Arthrobacter pascens]MDR6559817.1 AcrR family transcriptional regulator [Arthrobacter pascens]
MPKRRSTTQDPDTGMFAALELLIQKGYDSTSVVEFADAAGISRSTFFRRFGSKEDMLFADHDWILSRVAENLAESRREPLATISAAVLLVFNHHVRNRDYALLRHELLQRVELLRNREQHQAGTDVVFQTRGRTFALRLCEGRSPSDARLRSEGEIVSSGGNGTEHG